jgi:tripartite-type tricarboxylate transporter receptor subunit TctC
MSILALVGSAVAVASAADFPAKGKSITMILGTSAGGSTDVGARILAAALEKDLAATGTRIQVENKPGAG